MNKVQNLATTFRSRLEKRAKGYVTPAELRESIRVEHDYIVKSDDAIKRWVLRMSKQLYQLQAEIEQLKKGNTPPTQGNTPPTQGNTPPTQGNTPPTTPQ